MDNEQRRIFVQAATLGVACGLDHRYEWYTNAGRALGHGLYTEIAIKQQELDEAFVEFEKLTASCPEEQEQLDKLTPATYSEMVSTWYRDNRRVALQRSLDLG